METFFTLLICSLAISYLTELSQAVGWLKHLQIFLWSVSTVLFYSTSWLLVPIVLATAFLATTWIILINGVTSKPQVIPRRF
jgi:hypothetical protein